MKFIFSSLIDRLMLDIKQNERLFKLIIELLSIADPFYHWGSPYSNDRINILQVIDLYVFCVWRFAILLNEALAFTLEEDRRRLLQELEPQLLYTLQWAPFRRMHPGCKELVLTSEHLFVLAFGPLSPVGQKEMQDLLRFFKTLLPSKMGNSKEVLR